MELPAMLSQVQGSGRKGFAGKALPEICRDCAKLDEAERFDAVQLDEAGEPLPFVRVEASPPKTEFAAVEKAAEPAPKPEAKPERPPSKQALEVWRQSHGGTSVASFLLLMFVLYITFNANHSNEEGLSGLRDSISEYATILILVIGIQSFQFSRISNEIWQLRYEMAKRDAESKNPQN